MVEREVFNNPKNFLAGQAEPVTRTLSILSGGIFSELLWRLKIKFYAALRGRPARGTFQNRNHRALDRSFWSWAPVIWSKSSQLSDVDNSCKSDLRSGPGSQKKPMSETMKPYVCGRSWILCLLVIGDRRYIGLGWMSQVYGNRRDVYERSLDLVAQDECGGVQMTLHVKNCVSGANINEHWAMVTIQGLIV